MNCRTSGKRMLDKKGAMTVANSSKIVHNKEMRAYECPDCGAWHVATNDYKDFSNKRRSKETINDKRKKLRSWER